MERSNYMPMTAHPSSHKTEQHPQPHTHEITVPEEFGVSQNTTKNTVITVPYM